MGGLVSNFKKEQEPDDEENLRRYQDKLDADGTFGFSDELDKRKVKWWERIIFDKRLRITYVFILALILGLIIPMILFMTKLESRRAGIYGSCLINTNARFECLINSAKIADEKSCMRAMCCWENSDTLPFKCYHSLPSAYHYTLSNIETALINGTTWTTLETSSSRESGINMPNLKTHIHWESSTQLVIEIFNPTSFPNRTSGPMNKQSGNSPLQSNETDVPFAVSWGGTGEFFYFKVERSTTDETIFDTRLGPITSGDRYISLSTVLPTEYFYGLKGGQGSWSTLTYAGVHGFENVELPFYISYENSGKWHGVLIDTNTPMLTQVVQAPGIMFHLEADLPEMNLNFFAGPDQAAIVSQLYAHIRKKYNIAHAPMIPPYWGLGFHVCRKIGNGTIVRKDIDELLEQDKVTGFSLPFDSDCIDEDLRHPFDVDETRFGNISDILDKLKSKKILLSQKVTAPEDTSLNIDTWMLDANSTGPNITEFIGEVDNITVKYFDFFNPNMTQFPILPGNIPVVDGVSLDDNFPKLYNPGFACNPSESRIESWFSSPMSSSNGSQLNSTLLWSSVCPNSQHMVNPDELIKHGSLHNTYGERSLKTTYEKLHDEAGDSEMLISSSSIWINSLFYGAFNGLQVPFTWKGLQESVAHTIRNFALAPISGTPICGSPIYNMTLPPSEDLCLRWFQFGLLLPISRNTYDRVSSYGPLDLTNNKYYLAEAIRTRYTFAPYYYTTLYQYQTQYLPYIRPMTFHFHEESQRLRNESFALYSLSQFMIGEAILAAPIIEREVTRRAYFPPGVWYTKEGLEVWNREFSSFQQITGYISETPIFVRGGHIIPTLDDPNDASTSIMETLREHNYTLLIALSSVFGAGSGASRNASGTLTVKDIGVNSFHHVEFYAAFFPSTDTIMISINSTCSPMYFIGEDDDNHISTVIDQIKIFGTPLGSQLPEVIVKNGDVEQNVTPSRYGDQHALLVTNLNMDWCGEKNELTTSTYESTTMNDLTTTIDLEE